MYLFDSQTRRAWPAYWANHKFKAIRAAVIEDLSEQSAPSAELPESPGCITSPPKSGLSEREIRLESERRWAAYCLEPRDLEHYKAEVTRQLKRQSGWA